MENKYLIHVESVAEELNMNGFNVEVKTEKYQIWIEYDTMAGKMIYCCSETTIIGDFYRFVSNYGSKLQKWGLDNKNIVARQELLKN